MSFDQVNIAHYPLPMRKYGQNPFSENLYRIVRSDSVRHLVGGEWSGGERCYQWVPTYRNLHCMWILERWDWARMTKAAWEALTDPFSGWPVLGPYPNRGEYRLAFQFDLGVLSDSLDNIIGAIERKRLRSYQDDRDQIAAEYEKEENDTRSAADAEIRDAFTAFGVTPKPISSLTGVSRGTKTLPALHSAESLGLPVPGFGGRPKQNSRGMEFRSSLIGR